MKHPILSLILLTAIPFSCYKKDSSLMADSSKQEIIEIFTDGVGEGMILTQWPLNGTVVKQETTTIAGRGKVWRVQRSHGKLGVAHIQFANGGHDLSRFSDGRLEFDFQVIKGQGASPMFIKLDGGYPKVAAMQISLDTLQEESLSIETEHKTTTDACRQRESTIIQAKRHGELETLKKSSDPMMAPCIELIMGLTQKEDDPAPPANQASEWKHISISLAELKKHMDFQFNLVRDPFVVEFPEQREYEVLFDNIRLIRDLPREDEDAPIPSPVVDPNDIGDQSTTGEMVNGVSVTKGTIRVRRRHENDLDFSKYNPFYWNGRLVKFTIEDFTPLKQNKLKFTLETEQPNTVGKVGHWPVASWIYSGDPNGRDETVRSKFYQDAEMKSVGNSRTKFQYEWNANMNDPKIAAAMSPGSTMVVEFRVFLDKEDPFFVSQKAVNPHTLFNYYSEFFRIKIGSPGLHIDSLSDKESTGSDKRYAGGWTTSPTVRVEPWRGLQQQATNILAENSKEFMMGRTWFHTDFVTGTHTKDEEDDKPVVFTEEMKAGRRGISGSAYNVTACNICHINNGTSLLPPKGIPIHATIAKTMKGDGSPHDKFGTQLQTQGPDKEGTLVVDHYETRTERFTDGTTVRLRKPIFKIQGHRNSEEVALSIRRPPALIGIGLLEAVSDSTIQELAALSKGVISVVDGGIGKFGWKASQKSIRGQTIAALKNDMAVLVNNHDQLDCDDCSEGSTLNQKVVDKIEAYLSLLATPPRNYPEAPHIVKGEKVFKHLGCPSCHVATLKTKGDANFPELRSQTIHPYTDLLLHDMGEGLADEVSSSNASMWRTAPLWGLKNVRNANRVQKVRGTTVSMSQTWPIAEKNPMQLLHDGRAESIPEAILWHGGEALPTVIKYKELPASDRMALEAFLLDL